MFFMYLKHLNLLFLVSLHSKSWGICWRKLVTQGIVQFCWMISLRYSFLVNLW